MAAETQQKPRLADETAGRSNTTHLTVGRELCDKSFPKAPGFSLYSWLTDDSLGHHCFMGSRILNDRPVKPSKLALRVMLE